MVRLPRCASLDVRYGLVIEPPTIHKRSASLRSHRSSFLFLQFQLSNFVPIAGLKTLQGQLYLMRYNAFSFIVVTIKNAYHFGSHFSPVSTLLSFSAQWMISTIWWDSLLWWVFVRDFFTQTFSVRLFIFIRSEKTVTKFKTSFLNVQN